MYIRFIKRILDVFLSFLAILILIIPIAIIALIIKISSVGPVFFTQKRVGINKSHFQILKFRTMYTNTPKDVPTHLLENPNSFITPIGKFLRKFSLDELPQIFNIFIGNMSFVGPRPALWNQFDLIELRDKYNANSIRPGLTGLAQINGRDELPINVKAKYDGDYLNKISLFFDIKCMFLTFYQALFHKGVVEGNNQKLENK